MKQVLPKKVFFKGSSYGKGYVYALVDPRTNEVRYIGSTNNLLRRLNEHMRLYGGNKCKNIWLKELKDSSMLPYVLTLKFLRTKDITRIVKTLGENTTWRQVQTC